MSQEQIVTIALTTIPNLVVILVGLRIGHLRLADMSSAIDTMASLLDDMSRALDHLDAGIGDLGARVDGRPPQAHGT